ncbi:MAG: FAD:protein FMN transferase [Thermogutta sp.]|nr:FAD:protein FMN transferase [Thermogutta sp.]
MVLLLLLSAGTVARGESGGVGAPPLKAEAAASPAAARSRADDPLPGDGLQRVVWEGEEMAAPLRIVCYHASAEHATAACRQAASRIRELNAVFSDYQEDSEVRRLCETAGRRLAVPVSPDLWELLSLSLEISRQSGGAFDVTLGPLIRLWRRARTLRELPPAWRFEEARRAVGFDKLRLDADGRTVELTAPGMRLDFGAIAKGYAVDAALQVLRENGVPRALVDLGGDIGLGDPPPGREGWIVAVAPPEPDRPPSLFTCLRNCGTATSGDRYRFVIIEGVRYSHILDPKTGLGITTPREVMVIAPTGAAADAWATAISVLGPEAGLPLIDALADTAALILQSEDGKTAVYRSRRWPALAGESRVPAAEATP